MDGTLATKYRRAWRVRQSNNEKVGGGPACESVLVRPLNTYGRRVHPTDKTGDTKEMTRQIICRPIDP